MNNTSNWKIALIDDEEDVLQISKLVLKNLTFDNRGVELITAASGKDGQILFELNTDIAVAFIDVVMETKHAGLDLVKHIREKIGNMTTRIILRTGNPGSAPQKDVVSFFEIDDYKEKTELTADRLETSVITSLRAYRNIKTRIAIEEGLEKVIHSQNGLHPQLGLSAFVTTALNQIFYILDIGPEKFGLVVHEKSDLFMPIILQENDSEIMLKDVNYVTPEYIANDFKCIVKDNILHNSENGIFFSLRPNSDERFFFWVKNQSSLTKTQVRISNIFLSRLSVSLSNVMLQSEIIGAQSEILGRLCGAIESRSKETGCHIFRIEHYSRKMAHLIGLSQEDVELITLASPMHDIGKIGIPDQILGKPSKLTDDEWQVMKTHPDIGFKLLSKSKFHIIETAAIIAYTHHEKWDGSGYPRGISGSDIPIFGRIVTIVDVFDALLSKRSYKEAWKLDQVATEILKLKGSHLDPDLVDILIENIDDFHNIYLSYPD